MTQSVVTLRDNSTWNCQNPVLPGGLTPVPNVDPRNIEWLYGRDPGGAIFNTITGTVNIATLGSAPQTSGRISPVPYGPSSLSQAITIPATARAGQYFRVYLKNWNKCNWVDPEYVSTYVDIEVVASPPPPTAPEQKNMFRRRQDSFSHKHSHRNYIMVPRRRPYKPLGHRHFLCSS